MKLIFFLLFFFPVSAFANSICNNDEISDFNLTEFVKKYNIDEPNYSDGGYDVNFLIEDIHNGLLNIEDNKLKALQYFCDKGTGSKRELDDSLDFLEKSWRGEINDEFRFCDFVWSRVGTNVCSIRAQEKAKKTTEVSIENLKSKYDLNISNKIDDLMLIAENYFDSVARNETHKENSSLQLYFILSDIEERNNQLKDLLISDKLIYSDNISLNNEELNNYYQDVTLAIETYGSGNGELKNLYSEFDEDFGFIFYADDIKITQEQFSSYKNKLIEVLSTIKPNLNSSIIENNLNYQRKNELYPLHKQLTKKYFDKTNNPYCDSVGVQDEIPLSCYTTSNSYISSTGHKYYVESNFKEAYSKSKKDGFNYFWWNNELYSTK